MEMLFAAVHESGGGTSLPFAALLVTAAIEGQADLSRTSRNRRDSPTGTANSRGIAPARTGSALGVIARQWSLCNATARLRLIV